MFHALIILFVPNHHMIALHSLCFDHFYFSFTWMGGGHSALATVRSTFLMPKAETFCFVFFFLF